MATMTMAELAILVGADLRVAKKLMPHGHWKKWLERNFELSTRTAQVYMRLAELAASGGLNSQHAAYLSVRQALALGRVKRSTTREPGTDLRQEAITSWLSELEKFLRDRSVPRFF